MADFSQLVIVLMIGIPVVLLGWFAYTRIKVAAYSKAVLEAGWQFEEGPDQRCVAGVNNPPFGVGFNREAKHLVQGKTSSGLPFWAAKYKASGWSSKGNMVVAVALPQALPGVTLQRPESPVPPVAGSELSLGTHSVVAEDAEFGRAALAAIGAPLEAFWAHVPVSVTIDHANVVALGVSADVADLRIAVDLLEPVARALAAPAFAAYAVSPAPDELSFYARPDYAYRARDDAFLDYVSASRSGSNHRATNVVFRQHGPLPFVALHHTWETTRTVTESDGKGGTQTRTVTDHHDADHLEFFPTFPFVPFAVNPGFFRGFDFGPRSTFESEDFNASFTVRSRNSKSAHDVFHPRMMEYVMAANPEPFWVDGGRVVIGIGQHDPVIIARVDDFLAGFFARVPSFVWDDLGSPPPYPQP